MFGLFTQKPPTPPRKVSDVLDQHLRTIARSNRLKNLALAGVMLTSMVVMIQRMNADSTTTGTGASPHIAHIAFSGNVTSQNHQTSGMVTAQAIRKAMNNPNAKAILVTANSGGGSPVQAEIIANTIKDLQSKRFQSAPEDDRASHVLKRSVLADYSKPIIVVVEDLCASACYGAFSGADSIIAHSNSIVGSIGVRLDSWQLQDALAKIGVERVTITSGEDKALMDPFVHITDEKKAKLKSQLITPLYDIFVETVKANRGDKLDLSEPDLFTGMIFHGAKARDIGLVDDIQSLDMVTSQLKAEYNTKNVVIYNKPEFSIREILTSSIENAVSSYVNHTFSLN
ncbi:MAG: hypothetical protein GJ680_07405 [Alteromonadaceae bacterium]|nr:hypothetical protein [Alteromonadaceae bacterium]